MATTWIKAPEIRPLTGIRIIAAVWVVVEHFRDPLFALFHLGAISRDGVESGYLGVEVFFVLSGFIISHTYAVRLQQFTWPVYGRFIRARLARLYPVHLVTLLAVVALVGAAAATGVALNSGAKYTLFSFAMNLGMVQAIPPALTWNGPAWSISTEFGAYLAFPLLAAIILRVRSVAALTGAGIAMTCTIGGAFLCFAGRDYSYTSFTMMWLRIGGEFTAGCFLWALWHRAAPSTRGDLLAVIGGAGIATIVLVFRGQGPKDFLILPFVALAIYGCASATGPVARFLSSRWMEYGGRLSYSLYMWHFIVLMIVGKVLPWAPRAGSGIAVRAGVMFAYYAAALVGAAVLYHAVETPGRLRILGRTSNGVLRVPPAGHRPSVAVIDETEVATR